MKTEVKNKNLLYVGDILCTTSDAECPRRVKDQFGHYLTDRNGKPLLYDSLRPADEYARFTDAFGWIRVFKLEH